MTDIEEMATRNILMKEIQMLKNNMKNLKKLNIKWPISD